MSVIQASSVNARTMADGTLRLSFDVDPRYARDAFELFGMPGAPAVLAKLTQEAALQAAQKEALGEKPKGGPLSKSVAMMCSDEAFQRFIGVQSEPMAAEYVRKSCGVSSRAELDSNIEAKQKLSNIMAHYRVWRDQQGLD